VTFTIEKKVRFEFPFEKARKSLGAKKKANGDLLSSNEKKKSQEDKKEARRSLRKCQ